MLSKGCRLIVEERTEREEHTDKTKRLRINVQWKRVTECIDTESLVVHWQNVEAQTILPQSCKYMKSV